MSEGVQRDEVAAALRARHELGPEYEDAVVDSLVEKLERRLAERKPRQHRPSPAAAVPIALGSLGLAIPLLAIAGGTVGLPGVIAVCVAIVLVNVAARRS